MSKRSPSRVGPAVAATLLLSTLLLLDGCSHQSVVTALASGDPNELGRVLVEEEGRIVDVCSDFEVSSAASRSEKITTLLKQERTTNLAAILDALRGPKTAAEGVANSCRSDDIKQCATDIKAAYTSAMASNTQLAEVAKGMDAAFGKLAAITPESIEALAARIRFSMLAVDGYIRLAQALEHELDDFVAGMDIPIPLASSIARAAAREAAAEVIAAGTDKVVDRLERHSLVHRPSMIRQACERYLGERTSGVVATRGLQRIILSPSTNPGEFVKKRCDLIKITAERDGQTTTYDACKVIAAAAGEKRPSAKAVVMRGDDVVAPANVKGSMPAPLPLPPPEDPRHVPDANEKKKNAQTASVVQSAALACQELASGRVATPVPCTLGTFNALGSAATIAPPAADPQTDTPDTRAVTDLVRRVEELVAAQGRTVVTLDRLRTDLESVGGSIDSRLDSVERVVGALSLAQRGVTSLVAKCQKDQENVRNARRAAFEKLGTGRTFDSICGAYEDRWVSRALTLPASGPSSPTVRAGILVAAAELCSEHLPVSTAVTFDGGLFGVGKSTLTEEAKARLVAVWNELERAAAAGAAAAPALQAASAPRTALVFGHVDPQPFLVGESGKQQRQLMEKRAQSAIAELRAENERAVAQHRPQAKHVDLEARAGHVPPRASCNGSERECSVWRTVSIEYPALFPVLACK